MQPGEVKSARVSTLAPVLLAGAHIFDEEANRIGMIPGKNLCGGKFEVIEVAFEKEPKIREIQQGNT